MKRQIILLAFFIATMFVFTGCSCDHSETEWITTTEATLVDNGMEELVCINCDEILDNRETDTKLPSVDGTSFNFTDDEFIAWFENDSDLKFVLMETEENNSWYGITSTSNDDTGILLLNHGENDTDSQVCLIAFRFFDNDLMGAALATYVGEEIDSDFSSDDAFVELYYDDTYTKAGMTTTMLELSEGSNYAVIAPSEFFEEILE